MGQLTRNELFTLAVQKYSDAVYRAAMHNCRCAADAEDVFATAGIYFSAIKKEAGAILQG